MQIHHQREERTRLKQLVDRGTFGRSLTPAESATIAGLWRTVHHHPSNSPIRVEQGVRLITSGWAGWLRRAPDGRRLIFLFLLPGDFIVPGLAAPGCDLITLTPMRTVDASILTQESGPPSSEALLLIQNSGLRYRRLLLDHLTRLLIGSTTSSLALLLIELHDRSVGSGACEQGRFDLPIGQRLLAAALGRSAVQINKVIRRFQDDRLITVGYDWIQIVDLDGLRALSGMQEGENAFVIAEPEAEAFERPSTIDPELLQELIIS